MSEEKQLYARNLLELFSGKKPRPFKPSCSYQKELDWLLWVWRDRPYVATRSSNPYLELLKDGKKLVGMKVLHFSTFPREIRQRLLENTGIDPDEIRGIEEIWMLNFEEMRPMIEAGQNAFFRELRRREWRDWNDLLRDDAGCLSKQERHGRVMRHLAQLDPDRFPG